MKQMVLREKHLQLKARMSDFQGWQVPLQYSDGQDEYYAVRTAVGLFETSFLGRIEITGPNAEDLLQNVFTRNTGKMSEGSAHYGFICNEDGFILDDAVLFRLANAQKNTRYLLSTNAMNTGKILLWLKRHAPDDVEITDTTHITAHLSLQGPRSPHVLERLIPAPFKKLKPRTAREISLLDRKVLVSRTGYTGEHGYELVIASDRAEALWDAILAAGTELGIKPCGLACRDTVRLEMGYLLYGNDIDETRNPIEAGYGSFVDLKKEFIGKAALLKVKTAGTTQKLAGFALLDKGVPRSGGCIFSENREIGTVTSGAQSPHMRAGIGLGYLLTRYSQPGQEIEIEVRDREIAAKVLELPFYKKK